MPQINEKAMDFRGLELRCTEVTASGPMTATTFTASSGMGLGVGTGTSLALTAGLTAASVATTAGITSSSSTAAGVGYATGAGGAVTQITSRATGVTLNRLAGVITTTADALLAETTVDFVVTNSAIALTDTVIVSVRSGSNGGSTIVSVIGVAAGNFTIRTHNGNAAAGTSETGVILINYAIIKAVAA